MNIYPDPVWPWSNLWTFLASSTFLVRLFVLFACALLFALPFLHGEDERRRRWLRGCLIGGGVFFLLVAFRSWGSLGETVRAVGFLLLLLAPLALISLTISTYLGATDASPRRVAAILGLRLLAFVLVLLAVFRPALAFTEDVTSRAMLFIVVDRSESMETSDMFGKPRWTYLLQTLDEVQPLLADLDEEKQIETRFFYFDVDVDSFDPANPGEAKGTRTDFGTMLHKLRDQRDADTPLLAMLVLSDGADNGTTYTALLEAASWKKTPIDTFGFGKESSSDNRNDISVVSVNAEPVPVPVKGKLTLKVTIDAPGFKNRKVRLRLYLEDEEVQAKDEVLTQTTDNIVTIDCTAPSKPGDVMVRVRVEDPRRPGQPLPGEISDKNNEKITFVPVTKEGFSVLLVDKLRGFEPQQIRHALQEDSRLNLHTVQLRGDRPANLDAADLFQLAKKEYDVIILGDVTPAQLTAINPRALEEIATQVEAGTGLLMIGGYASFGPEWRNTPVAPLLPVVVGGDVQIENEVKMLPTEEGLRKFSYVLGLGESPEASRQAWQSLHELQGINKLTLPLDRATVSLLAKSDTDEPILVSKVVGAGRVLAFAGDSTHRWIRDRATYRLHHQFWLQMVRWLGKQDEVEGSVWVSPDTRNLPLRSDLGFTVGLRTKNGVKFKGGTFTAKVHTPEGQVIDVKTSEQAEGERGTFLAKDQQGTYRKPGVYRIEATGNGTSPDGEEVSGTGTARFVLEDDDIEKARKAADLTFLKKLSAAGGGKFQLPGALRDYLEKLQGREKQENRLQTKTWPAWRTNSTSPFFVMFFLLFVALLASEWLLRRAWGLV